MNAAARQSTTGWHDEVRGSPLSPAEIEFATTRMPVCTCPALVTLDGRRFIHHRAACLTRAGHFLTER